MVNNQVEQFWNCHIYLQSDVTPFFEIIGYTGTETRQLSFFACLKRQEVFHESSIPISNVIAVSAQYVPSASVILHARLNDQSHHTQLNKTNSKENRREQQNFLKWDIVMTNQSHVFTMHMFVSLLYTLDVQQSTHNTAG